MKLFCKILNLKDNLILHKTYSKLFLSPHVLYTILIDSTIFKRLSLLTTRNSLIREKHTLNQLLARNEFKKLFNYIINSNPHNIIAEVIKQKNLSYRKSASITQLTIRIKNYTENLKKKIKLQFRIFASKS